jgi:hypothetical protein
VGIVAAVNVLEKRRISCLPGIISWILHPSRGTVSAMLSSLLAKYQEYKVVISETQIDKVLGSQLLFANVVWY